MRKYYANVEPQNRSFGVTLSYVTMDVVIATSRHLDKNEALRALLFKADALDEAKAWIDHPLLIPDRDLGHWVESHPKRQLAWTSELNAECGQYFVPLVTMFKWWTKTYSRPKYPKWSSVGSWRRALRRTSAAGCAGCGASG